MLKQTIIAGLAVVGAVFVTQPVEKAQAGVKFELGIGIPGTYYEDPHYYEPRYYERRRRYRPRRHKYRYGRLSCREARRVVRRHGYYRIRAIDCSGSRYTFHAKRDGEWYRLRMRSRSGRIYNVGYL